VRDLRHNVDVAKEVDAYIMMRTSKERHCSSCLSWLESIFIYLSRYCFLCFNFVFLLFLVPHRPRGESHQFISLKRQRSNKL